MKKANYYLTLLTDPRLSQGVRVKQPKKILKMGVLDKANLDLLIEDLWDHCVKFCNNKNEFGIVDVLHKALAIKDKIIGKMDISIPGHYFRDLNKSMIFQNRSHHFFSSFPDLSDDEVYRNTKIILEDPFGDHQMFINRVFIHDVFTPEKLFKWISTIRLTFMVKEEGEEDVYKCIESPLNIRVELK